MSSRGILFPHISFKKKVPKSKFFSGAYYLRCKYKTKLDLYFVSVKFAETNLYIFFHLIKLISNGKFWNLSCDSFFPRAFFQWCFYQYLKNRVFMFKFACIYPTLPLREGCDTRSIFKWSKAALNSLSFPSRLVAKPGLKNPICSTIYTLLKETDRFLPFPKGISAE